MKKLYAICLIFALIGCSDNKAELKNKYQAWNDTYWGMTEQQLLNFIEIDNTSSEINKGECNKEYIQSQNLESCQSISLDNYKIGNQHYQISFRLENNQLSNIYFMHNESSEILASSNNNSIEEILRSNNLMRQVSWEASIELYKLLSEKYGEPNSKNINSGKFSELNAMWEKDYTIIELKNLGIMTSLSYKPNKTNFYLDTVPKDHYKL